jgi:hypothetical protein
MEAPTNSSVFEQFVKLDQIGMAQRRQRTEFLLETEQSVGPWLSQNLHCDGMTALTVVRFVHGSEATSSQTAAYLEAVRKSDLDRKGERWQQIGIGGGGVDSQAEVSGEFRVFVRNSLQEPGSFLRTAEGHRAQKVFNLALSLGIQDWTSCNACSSYHGKPEGYRLLHKAA